MTVDQAYQAVVAAPSDDELRRQLAEACKTSDPDRSRFIELQLARAASRRASRSAMDDVSREEAALVKRYDSVWSRTLAKYTVHREYYRGAVESIVVDPHVFLEYGEWLLKLAPIRNVYFTRPEGGATCPLSQLLSSGLLSFVDSVEFCHQRFGDADIERIAASRSLENCLVLNLSYNDLTLRSFDALAAAPSLRSLLYIERAGGGPDSYIPGEHFVPKEEMKLWGANDWEISDIDDEGKALEQKYGYIPWLHYANFCSYFDARWYVDHGILPVKPSRSPVDHHDGR